MALLFWMLWISVLLKTFGFGNTQIIYEERSEKNCALEKLTPSNPVIMLLNERISKLEDELQIVKETYSRQEILGFELLKNGSQNSTMQIENLETKLAMTFNKAKTMINESFQKLLVEEKNSTIENIKILQETVEKSEMKLSEMVKNLSISVSKLENEITGLFRRTEQDVSSHKYDFNGKLENITTSIKTTNERLQLDAVNCNSTTSLLEQKVQDILKEQLSLMDDVASTNKEISIFKSNVTKISNVSQHQFSELTSSMSSLTEEIKKEQHDLIGFVANNISMAMENEVSLMKASLTNATNTMNNLIQLELNQSESKIDLMVQNISVAMTTLENKITDQLNNVRQDVSSYKPDLQGKLHEFYSLMTNNMSKEIANELSSILISLTTMTRRIDDQDRLIVQNMSAIEDFITQKCETQIQSIAINTSSKITDIENILLTRLEKQGFQNNETIKDMKHLNDFSEEINSKLNETSYQLINVYGDFRQIRQRMDSMENNQKQLEIYTNSSLAHIQSIEANISIFKESAFKTISSKVDDAAVNARQLTSRLNQVTGSISTLQSKATRFEQFHSSQNTRLSNIESRLSSASSSLTNIKNDLKKRYSGVIRLTNGGRTYGRVEVYHNGAWGTVCDDGWDTSDAQVACRIMGLSGGTARNEAYYGQGTGTIWLDDLGCTGYEPSLFACRHLTIGSHNCNHGEDVGVSCSY